MIGDESEIEDFCRREYAGLYRYVYALLGNHEDALEAVQESFLRFHRLCREENVRGSERPLLFRLARNVAIDLGRRRRTRLTRAREAADGKLLPFNPPEPRTPEELLLEKEAQRCAEQALAKLSQKEQDCLELRYGGLSYREVAGILQLSPNTVGPLMARALRKFREAYVELVEKKDASRESGDASRDARRR